MPGDALTTEFGRFWVGQSVSLVGSQVTTLALPLTAVLALGAGPREMGLLQAARFLPFLLLTLPIGLFVDRMHRRPLLIAADLGRALVIGAIPLAALTGTLRIELLYAVAFAAGVLTVVFDVAYITVAPWLVSADQLIRANARLMASQSFAEVAGPAIAGQLVQALTAPLAMLVDAVSFVVGGATIATLRTREPAPERRPRDVRLDLREGVAAVFRNRYVRAIGLMAATYNMVETGILALLILYATRLGFAPGALGVILGAGALGAFSGSFVAEAIAHRLGIGRTTMLAMIVETFVFIPVALLPDASPPSAAILIAALFANGWGSCVSTVHSMSVRQHVTPAQLLGRMNASYRLLVTGTVPIGALAAGLLAEAIGLRETLLLFAIALPSSLLWIASSPLPRLRTLDDAAPGPAS